MWCGDEMQMDPISGCTCVTNEEYNAYYPDWATEKDIDYSWKLFYQRFDEPVTVPRPESVHPGS